MASWSEEQEIADRKGSTRASLKYEFAALAAAHSGAPQSAAPAAPSPRSRAPADDTVQSAKCYGATAGVAPMWVARAPCDLRTM